MAFYTKQQLNTGGAGGVTQIIAGTNISISPGVGIGAVTINTIGVPTGTGNTNQIAFWTAPDVLGGNDDFSWAESAGIFSGAQGSVPGWNFNTNATTRNYRFFGLAFYPIPTFTGGGLNDMTIIKGGGYYQGPASNLYTITIDGTGIPDTFSWSATGGGGAAGVPITGSNQLLTDNVFIRFGATSSHTLGNNWTFVPQITGQSFQIDGHAGIIKIGDSLGLFDSTFVNVDFANQHLINQTGGDFKVQNTSAQPWIDINIPTSIASFGNSTAGNLTHLQIDDLAKTITNNLASGDFRVSNGGARMFEVHTAPSSTHVFMGDIDGTHNQTLISLDDNAKKVTIANSGISGIGDISGPINYGLYVDMTLNHIFGILGDVDGTHNGTGVKVDDNSGTVEIGDIIGNNTQFTVNKIANILTFGKATIVALNFNLSTSIFDIGDTTNINNNTHLTVNDATGFISLLGSQRMNVSSLKTVNYTVGTNFGDYIIQVDTTGGIITITLPAIPTTGDTYFVKDESGQSGVNAITVSGNGNNIDGSATNTIGTAYQSKQYTYTGTQWSIM